MQETTNEIYIRAKKDGILSKSQLEFFNMLCLNSPCTVNELIANINFNDVSIKPELIDRYPSQLKKIKLITVVEKRACKTSTSKRKIEVISPVLEYPDTTKLLKISNRTKLMIESSQNAALLAIEIFNNPNSRFKTESFVTLINNAWLKIFIAYLYMNNEEIYQKDKNGKYILINGTKDKKHKGFKECLKLCQSSLSNEESENLKVINKIRDKVEHCFIDEPNLDLIFFGRFQSNIMNYEKFLADNFGQNYCINKSLAFSLQFSQYNEPQIKSMKKLISQEAKDLKSFIREYEANLSPETITSQEFCLNVLMIPKITNNKNADFAVEFIREKDLGVDALETINAIIKDRNIICEAKHSGKLKPTQVIEMVNNLLDFKINTHHFVATCKIFKIRPYGKYIENPYKTYSPFCTYDVPHNDYVYTTDFVDFILSLFKKYKWDLKKINNLNQSKTVLCTDDYF